MCHIVSGPAIEDGIRSNRAVVSSQVARVLEGLGYERRKRSARHSRQGRQDRERTPRTHAENDANKVRSGPDSDSGSESDAGSGSDSESDTGSGSGSRDAIELAFPSRRLVEGLGPRLPNMESVAQRSH
jgi:hypothetical protein